jgi:hypothetical protein
MPYTTTPKKKGQYSLLEKTEAIERTGSGQTMTTVSNDLHIAMSKLSTFVKK